MDVIYIFDILSICLHYADFMKKSHSHTIPQPKPHLVAKVQDSIRTARSSLQVAGRPFFRLYLMTLLAFPHPARSKAIDVILLGGQSNMEGTGVTALAPASVRSQPPLQLYHSASLRSPARPNQWNTLGPAGNTTNLFGVELGAGFRLRDFMGRTDLALIKHARGGTKLTPNPISYETGSWYPGANAADTANWGQEFTNFVQTVNSGLSALESQGYTPQIVGMLWVQGEADATNAQAGADYEKNLTLMISRVREQFKVPAMPFVYAQVLPYQTRHSSVAVRQAMEDIDQDSGKPAAVTGAFMVPTEGMGEQGDAVHFNTPGQLALGQSLAHALAYRALAATDDNKTIAYWQLDEGSNPSYLLDAVGTYHMDLSISGTAAASLARISNPDTATFIDGTEPGMNPASLSNPVGLRRMYDEELDMRGEPFTFEGFFKNSDLATHKGYDVIGGNRSTLSGYHGWRVIMLDGQIRFFATNDSGRSASILSPSRYDDGLPHHFAATWDPAAGPDGQMSLYLDGSLVGSVPGVGDLGDEASFTKLFSIGAEASGTVGSPQASTWDWEGRLDELRLTRAVLTPAQFLNSSVNNSAN